MDSPFCHRNPDAPAALSGPLPGWKIAVQPNVSVAGWPADAGSNALADFKAIEDATIVKRLRQAGAFLCGSTRMSEFGFGLRGSRAGEAIRNRAADAELVLDLMGEPAGRHPRGRLRFQTQLWPRLAAWPDRPDPVHGILRAACESPATIRELLKAMAGQDP